MKLNADKPGMRPQFNDLHKIAIFTNPRKRHPVLFKKRSVLVVEFKTVTMALKNIFCSIHTANQRLIL